MSRKARLHVPGGLYYVVQRGNERQPLFSSPDDYASLEHLLAQMLPRCQMRAHAFCWTEHALHMAIEIGEMPLGRLMQRLASQYAREFHRRHGLCGHLFRQRYQTLLVNSEAYILKLIRHIHTVPVRLGLVRDAGDYPSSSHRAYLGMSIVPWLTTNTALRCLAHRPEQARQAYQLLMGGAPDEKLTTQFERGNVEDPRVLGDREFMAVIPRRERVLRSVHSLDHVIDRVSRTLAVERDEVLSRSRQRHLALARALIAWYATERGIATLAEVARRLQRDPSTLFVAIERYRSLRPELFKLSALHGGGPLIRMSP